MRPGESQHKTHKSMLALGRRHRVCSSSPFLLHIPRNDYRASALPHGGVHTRQDAKNCWYRHPTSTQCTLQDHAALARSFYFCPDMQCRCSVAECSPSFQKTIAAAWAPGGAAPHNAGCGATGVSSSRACPSACLHRTGHRSVPESRLPVGLGAELGRLDGDQRLAALSRHTRRVVAFSQ